MLFAGYKRGTPEDLKLYDPLEWATIGLESSDIPAAWGKVNQRLTHGGLDRVTFLFDLPAGAIGPPAADRKFGIMISPEFERYFENNPDLTRGGRPSARLARSGQLAPSIPGHAESDVQFDSWEFRLMAEFGFKGGFSGAFFNRSHSRYSVFLANSLTSTPDIARIYELFGANVRDALAYFNEALLLREITKREKPILAPRESECLLWVAQGMTTQQIADQLNLNDRTVDEYIASAVRKLNATNRTHACARAILLSLIAP